MALLSMPFLISEEVLFELDLISLCSHFIMINYALGSACLKFMIVYYRDIMFII